MNRNSILINVGKYTVAILFLIISIIPFIWIWSSAFKTNMEISENPFSLPKKLHIENISEVWYKGHFNIYFTNSLIVTIPNVILVVFLSSIAGFAFSKMKFIGRDILFYMFILGFTIPVQAIIISLFYDFQNYGLINKLSGLILAETGIGLPFGIFLMRSFFMNLPNEIYDAAKIDGCSNFRAFYSIFLPLAKPAVLSLVVFQTIWSWNEFLLALLLIQSEKLRTIPLGLMFLKGGRYTLNYSQIAAGITVVSLPLIIVYLIFQRTFIEGITAGAVKG
ncbi:MAG TPA: carbohydrate ABC transporter permease [Atribacter sp.]|nr:carbohydrate ABC transporter permease [Candidatus Atribacteria bacterium]HQK82682.1 carbohydrate ABC transporter permease [Atribacter sp.]